MGIRRRTLAAIAAGLGVLPATGSPNGALFFGPDDLVQVTPGPSVDSISAGITIEAWVKIAGITNLPTAVRRNLTGFVGGGEVYILRMNSFNLVTGVMHPAFYLRVGADSFSIEGNVPLSLAAWHHWAATFDGTFMRMYWDGALVALAVHPGSIAATSAPLFLGSGAGPDAWSGPLDEVRIWNVPRTQSQIQGGLHVSLAGSEPGLAAYWRFNEDGGPFAVDSSGNGNLGVLGILPVPDFADPARVPSDAPLVELLSISPPFGPFYGSTMVTIMGSAFAAVPGTAVTVGGQPATSVTVVDPTTILAVFPPGPVGPATVTVSTPVGAPSLPDAWEWADHLRADVTEISIAAGGSVGLSLFAESSNAGRLYLLASSLSGTAPGFPLPGSPLVLPLNPDVWTAIALLGVNGPIFSDFLGTLDVQGSGSASFDPGPPPLPPFALGLEISFAYVVFDSPTGGGFAFVSNPVTVSVTP